MFLFPSLPSKMISRDELKPGDHIYSWRLGYIYAHHAIYVGEGKVIHFTTAAGSGSGSYSSGSYLGLSIFSSSSSSSLGRWCPECGDQSRLDGVICSCIDCFLAGGDLYIFEYDVPVAIYLPNIRRTCSFLSSDPPEIVLRWAYYLLENGFGEYNLLGNNCEDFAIYCKTGCRIYWMI